MSRSRRGRALALTGLIVGLLPGRGNDGAGCLFALLLRVLGPGATGPAGTRTPVRPATAYGRSRDGLSEGSRTVAAVITVADVRALTRTLPRTTEHLIHDRVKFRVGAIVYVAFSRDEQTMGFGYPKEQRDGLIAAEPELFFLPRPSDLRFNWVCCHLARLDHAQMTELVSEAWRMVVPKFLARQRLGD